MQFPLVIDMPDVVRGYLKESLALIKDYRSLLTPSEINESPMMERLMFGLDINTIKSSIDETVVIHDKRTQKEFVNFLTASKNMNLIPHLDDSAYSKYISMITGISTRTVHPYKNEVDALIEQFMKDFYKYIKKEYKGYNLTGCEIKMDYSARRKTSYGGLRGIDIAMKHYVPKAYDILNDNLPDKYSYWEYKSYQKSPTIGSFTTKDWRLQLIAVFCHELAHYVQYSLYFTDRKKFSYMEKAHGNGFKDVYLGLRNEFVNPYLKAETLGQEYTL